MNDPIFYSVVCRKAGTSTRRPALLRTRYAKDTAFEGSSVTAVQRHSDLFYVTRKLSFTIPEGVNIQSDDQFTSTIVFAGGKKYPNVTVLIIRQQYNGCQYVTFKAII